MVKFVANHFKPITAMQHLFTGLLVFILCLTTSAPSTLKAQTSENEIITNRPPKNVVYATAGTYVLGVALSMNYERLIHQSKKDKPFGIYARVNAGAIASYFEGEGFVLGPSLQFFFNKFEIGAGALAYFEHFGDSKIGFLGPLPSLNIGYRKVSTKRNIIFRTGVSFPEAFYLSVGIPF